jgi:hypothetical protein
LMGAPAKKDGKATEGYKIMVGGKVGENPALATDFAPVSSALSVKQWVYDGVLG